MRSQAYSPGPFVVFCGIVTGLLLASVLVQGLDLLFGSVHEVPHERTRNHTTGSCPKCMNAQWAGATRCSECLVDLDEPIGRWDGCPLEEGQ